MSSFTLKMIGISTMLIDHIGIILLPQLALLRVIGRIAYPIFAFLISEGYRKTSDITDYLGRMLVFAFFTQLAFRQAMGEDASLNVLFTFALALYAIHAYEKHQDILIVVIVALAAELFHTDYGAYGVFMIFIFHEYHDDFKNIVRYFTLLTVGYILAGIGPAYIYIFKDPLLLFEYSFQLFALPALIFIYLYNGKRGPRAKYLFYIFYPGHLLILHYLKENWANLTALFR